MLDFEHRGGRFARAAIVLGLAAGSLLIVLTTGTPLPWPTPAGIEPAAVHLLLDLLCVVVASLTVATAWHAVGRERTTTGRLVLSGFTVVAGVHLVHAISQAGLAPWSASDVMVSGFFWLSTGAAQVLTIGAATLRVQTGAGRMTWFTAGLVTLLAFIGTGLVIGRAGPHPSHAEAVVVALGWALGVLNGMTAAWNWSHYQRTRETRYLWFAAACAVAALGELARLTVDASEVPLLAHLYRLVGYAFIYRGTFTASVEAPYAQLELSEATVKRQQDQLNTLLRNVPVGLAQLDRQLRYRYVNPVLASHLHTTPGDLAGTHWRNYLPASWQHPVGAHLHETLEGKRTEFEFEYQSEHGDTRHANAIMVPERNAHGEIEGVLAIFTDHTERERARRQLAESMREVTELKSALDAHAIVAVTDARGVITRVNDKFCIISKYRRSELLGSTHRLINSGHHPQSFFDTLWKTISSGMVWTGEICNRAKDGSLYWVYTTIVPFVGEEGIPVQYISIRADITERKRAEQEAQHMALYDVVTDLPNRRLMGERLREALTSSTRSDQYGALMLLDLDNFKQINDTLGHDQGDTLLRMVGERLQFSVRQADTVARMGGDEFVVILSDLGRGMQTALAAVQAISEKIRLSLSEPYDLDGAALDVTSSLGAVLFQGEDEREDKLLKRADMALYRAKAQGRNRLSVFDPGLESAILAQASLLQDLRQALPRRELVLHAQPIVDETGAVRSQEILLRWAHPTRGLVSPGEFIALAEQHGLILDIGNWVLRRTCAWLAACGRDPARSAWTAAINVSVRQLRDPGFVDAVLRALAETGAPAHRLRLELTESMLLTEVDETIAKMSRLREAGVRFALDDFGTGYSSLSYLRRLPLDELKIDRSFIADVAGEGNDGVIARTIISLANSLGLSAVAEGVETAEQFEALKALGCHAFQGYHFGRPLPLADL
ncbi:bifunctional diguanylate cyclase/phosphodiesterase [Aquabacterium olei]|nr:EAL domain-containing protein [Aquabacterium olei]